MVIKTKNRELNKILNGMEALGYQVDSIEMLPEGGFHTEPGRCVVHITASPLIETGVPPSIPPE